MIATLGVLAMVAFVFLPIVLDRMGARTIDDPVVVKTSKFGNLKRREIEMLQWQRQWVLNFLRRVQQAVDEKRVSEKSEKTGRMATAARQVEQNIGPATEQSVVDTWLCAQYAEQLGVVVSNRVVNGFIEELTESELTAGELEAIIESVGVSPQRFFPCLRHELLALRLQRMFAVSLAGTTPAQRWDYFTRLKRRADIEAVPVAVEKFVDKVADPPEKVLREFFEQHKENYAHPASPEPGFHEPYRIAVRYFRTDYEKFLAPDAVTDKEIEEYYQDHKEYFDQKTSEMQKESAVEKAEEAGQEKGMVVEMAEETEEEKKSESEEPNETEEEKKSEPEEPKETAKPGEASKDTSFEPVASSMMLTAALQEEALEDKAAEDAVPAANEEEPDQPKDVAPAAKEEKSNKPKDIKEVLAGPVGEIVRKELAERNAMEKIGDAFKQIEELVARYRGKRVRYDADLAGGKAGTPPKELDCEALARQHGLSTALTGLISQLQTQEYDIGRSLVGGRNDFAYFAYRDNWLSYLTATSIDQQGNQYLFWKTDETKAKIPEFDDEGVHLQVLHAWKMVRARSLASKEAQQLAEEARGAGTSLKEALANRPGIEVIEPAAFSWMTRGSVPEMWSPWTPARMSEIEGIDLPGPDFMRAVFNMQRGQVEVAMNLPQTVAYVVRLAELTPTPNVLWAQFESDPYVTYRDVARGEQGGIARAWRDELRSNAALQWMRKPDQRSQQ